MASIKLDYNITIGVLLDVIGTLNKINQLENIVHLFAQCDLKLAKKNKKKNPSFVESDHLEDESEHCGLVFIEKILA